MAKKKSPKGQLARRPERSVVSASAGPQELLADLREMIDQSRQAVAQTVNAALVWLYWNIGKRIREDILKQQRAEYGEEIVSALSAQLTAEYGRGFAEKSLRHMIRFCRGIF